MAILELTLLDEHLEAKDIAALEKALSEAGSSPLDIDDTAEIAVLERNLDDELLAEVLDRLDANDAACDIYVPPRFEEVFEIGGYRIGSAPWLGEVLVELRDEFGGDTEMGELDAELDEYEGDADAYTGDEIPDQFEIKEAQLYAIWKALYAASQEAHTRGLALMVRS